jgi:hypothetical protein
MIFVPSVALWQMPVAHPSPLFFPETCQDSSPHTIRRCHERPRSRAALGIANGTCIGKRLTKLLAFQAEPGSSELARVQLLARLEDCRDAPTFNTSVHSHVHSFRTSRSDHAESWRRRPGNQVRSLILWPTQRLVCTTIHNSLQPQMGPRMKMVTVCDSEGGNL